MNKLFIICLVVAIAAEAFAEEAEDRGHYRRRRARRRRRYGCENALELFLDVACVDYPEFAAGEEAMHPEDSRFVCPVEETTTPEPDDETTAAMGRGLDRHYYRHRHHRRRGTCRGFFYRFRNYLCENDEGAVATYFRFSWCPAMDDETTTPAAGR